jgi:hypothetical protein
MDLTPVLAEPPEPDQEAQAAAPPPADPPEWPAQDEAPPDEDYFDAEPPSFSGVLSPADPAPPAQAAPPRRWLPVIVFAVIVAACVLLGIVILRQVGILGLGVDLSPMSPLTFLGGARL